MHFNRINCINLNNKINKKKIKQVSLI